MIIDFSVKNFRSIREEQKLSFVASNYDRSLPENLMDPGLPGDLSRIKLLRGVGLYGPNAGGKTNVLKALRFLSHLVEESASELDEGDSTGTEPFALDTGASDEASEFVLRFVVDGVRYHFILVLDRTRVLYESLSAFPKGREQVWYERSWNEESGSYTWAPERPIGYRRDPNLEKYTRSNALFLSTAVKLNEEQLKPIYLWFKEKLRFLRLGAHFPPLSPNFTAQLLIESPNLKTRLTKMLQHADFGVVSAQAEERVVSREDLPADMPEEIAKKFLDQKHVEITLGHRGAAGSEFPLSWKSESDGTQKFFSLAGPWLDILKNGYFAGLDEIESSMHPSMVIELLKLFFSNETNQSNAQILFTTHNPLLLDPTLIRRDQIWFADKDDEGATHLYPLSDYKPRKSESLIRGYMAGRYGAVPFIPEGLLGKEEPVHAE